MPTASSTRMKTEISPARVTPCSAIVRKVRKAKPTMNSSTTESTTRRLISPARGGGRPSSARPQRCPRSPAAGDQADREHSEEEAADVGEVGDAFAADRAREAGEAE